MRRRLYVPATAELLAGWVDSGQLPGDAGGVPAAGDDEESEYLAMMTAADWSADLGGRRRFVVVVESDRPDGVPLPMSEVVAVHADTEDHADREADLAWFATQEIPDLLAWNRP